MGIYDREYYRDDSGGFWGTITGHRTTWGLITITVAAWLGQVVTAFPGQAGPPFDLVGQWFAFHQESVLHGQVWRLLTANFVHTPFSLIAVGFGMLGLYWFGSPIEDVYGPKEFLGFYLVTGLLIGLGELFVGFAQNNPNHFYFGSAGVLMGVFVLYACHFPNARILLMFIIPVPAWLLVTIIVGLNILASLRDPSGPVPTLLAVGFTFLYFRTQFRIWPPIQSVIDAVTGLFGRTRRRPPLRVAEEPEDDEPVPAAAPAPRAAKPARSVDEQLEAKLDHVLEKVSRHGRESLTPEEREILLRASEIYKRRRGN